MRPKGSHVRLMNYTVTKVYYTLKELTQLTGLNRYRISEILRRKEVPIHQESKGRTIRIHINEMRIYFNVDL